MWKTTEVVVLSKDRWDFTKSISQAGERFYLYKERWCDELQAPVKDIADLHRDAALAERVTLALNALSGIPTEHLKTLVSELHDKPPIIDQITEAIRARKSISLLRKVRAKAPQ